MSNSLPKSRPGPSRRDIYATYASGFFSLSMIPMYMLIIPLWTLTLEASATLIGIAVGARSLLPTFFSIHGGVLMDKLGIRRVMMWCALGTMVLGPLHPFMPWIGAVIVLQLIGGLMLGFSWMGSQIQIGQMTLGSPEHAGRFSFFSNAGIAVGPLIVGASWDWFGPIGAFVLLGFWGAGLLVAVIFMPASERGHRVDAAPLRRRQLMPRWVDYRDAFNMLRHGAIFLVIAATFIRLSAISVQGSFYPVYLESISLSGSVIGFLVGAAALSASFAGLLTGPMTRLMAPSWMLIITVATTVIFISVTPLFADVTLLLVLAMLFGVSYGFSLPLVISILSRAAGPDKQGMSVGLRTTANRVASLVIPLVMGFLADLYDIANSFFVVGAGLLVLTLVLGFLVSRGKARP